MCDINAAPTSHHSPHDGANRDAVPAAAPAAATPRRLPRRQQQRPGLVPCQQPLLQLANTRVVPRLRHTLLGHRLLAHLHVMDAPCMAVG